MSETIQAALIRFEDGHPLAVIESEPRAGGKKGRLVARVEWEVSGLGYRLRSASVVIGVRGEPIKANQAEGSYLTRMTQADQGGGGGGRLDS